MPSPLSVGIDVSSQDNVVCCLTRDEEKRPLSRFTVSNNRPGITEFCQRIVSLIQKHGFDQILFGLEHTGCYSTHVAMYLERHLDFNCPDVRVYMFYPSLIKEFKKAHCLDAPKNDRVDAWFIASRLRSGHLPHPFTWNEPLMALQRLTRARFHLMKDLTRESNFLMTNLYLKFSDYTVVPFDNKLSATSLAAWRNLNRSRLSPIYRWTSSSTLWSNTAKADFTTQKPSPEPYKRRHAHRTVYRSPWRIP